MGDQFLAEKGGSCRGTDGRSMGSKESKERKTSAGESNDMLGWWVAKGADLLVALSKRISTVSTGFRTGLRATRVASPCGRRVYIRRHHYQRDASVTSRSRAIHSGCTGNVADISATTCRLPYWAWNVVVRSMLRWIVSRSPATSL